MYDGSRLALPRFFCVLVLKCERPRSSRTSIMLQIFDALSLSCTEHKMKWSHFGMVKTCSLPSRRNGEQNHFGSMVPVTTILRLCFDRLEHLSTNSMNSWICT
jgi:hypothetical protein